MTKYTDITSYFKNLAEKYLGHTLTEKRFFRKGLDEFLNGIVIDSQQPVMLLDKYNYTYSDNTSDNVFKVRDIAFMIVKRVTDIDDYDAIDIIQDDCEEIIDNIYNQIRSDMIPPRNDIMKFSTLNLTEVTPIKNMADGNFGYYVTVDIRSIHSTTLPTP